MQLVVPQKHLGPRSLLVCVMAIFIITILSIDMYVPALPGMQKSFGVTAAYLNATMYVYFAVATICILLAGFLVDRYGRKRIILVAAIVFTLSSLGAALSPSVEVLVLFRCGQALGYGFMTTAATALVKDAYDGRDLQLAMTAMQSLILLGPAIAPFLGSFMVETIGWRGIFGVLTAAGAVAIVMASLITETYQKRGHDGALSVGQGLDLLFRRSRALFRKRSFTALTLFFSVCALPYFAFIAVASYVLLEEFGTSYLEYSLSYAAICLTSLAAPYVYAALSKRVFPRWILLLTVVIVGVAAAGLFGPGSRAPLAFTVFVAVYALAEGIARPLAFVELLQQKDEYVGTASSLANFVYGIATVLGSALATAPWPSYAYGIAALTAVTCACMAVLYAWGLRRDL